MLGCGAALCRLRIGDESLSHYRFQSFYVVVFKVTVLVVAHHQQVSLKLLFLG